MRRFCQNHSPRRRSLFLHRRILLFGLLLTACFLFFGQEHNELLHRVIEERMQLLGSSFLSQQVQKTLSLREDPYPELVTLTETAEHTISSVQINTCSLEQMESEVVSQLTASLSSLSEEKIRLPLGILLGSEVLGGYGPKIPFTVYPIGSLHTKSISSFDAVGINQTRHRILLTLSLDLSCNLLLDRQTTSVSYDFVLAETILVGDVPESYTEVISNEDTLSKINDYGASP